MSLPGYTCFDMAARLYADLFPGLAKEINGDDPKMMRIAAALEEACAYGEKSVNAMSDINDVDSGVSSDRQTTEGARDLAQSRPANQRWSEYGTPLCPQCGSKAVYQSAVGTDDSRVCSCGEGHTWALDAKGAEL